MAIQFSGFFWKKIADIDNSRLCFKDVVLGEKKEV